ncbi:MAG: pitrilysin family protein [Acidaminobacteraceae bacterium]
MNVLKLKNGLTLIYEKLEASRSVSIGYWVKVGSIDEKKENNGMAHFIEHMLFKGTTNRSSKDIAIEIDKVGGELNAFTSKECTCFYTTVLNKHVRNALEILSDMLINSEFLAEEIEREKTVIIEEVHLYEDSPEDILEDLASAIIYKNSPLEMPIIGTEETIKSMDREKIKDFFSKYYGSNNSVVSVAGNFDEKELVNLVEILFADVNAGKSNERIPQKDLFVSDYTFKKKDLEVNHYNISFDGVDYDSDEMYTLLLVNNILGGSVSSRLFQTVREDLGLVYSIDTGPNFHSELGTFHVSYSTIDAKFDKLTEVLVEELNMLVSDGITLEEVELSKQQLVSSYLLGLDDSSSYMTWLGKSLIMSERIKLEEEVLAKIDSIDIKDANKLIKKIFDKEKFTVCTVGNTAEEKSKLLFDYMKKHLK